MPYVSQEQIEDAKKMDLLAYLRTFEPDELVHFSSSVYTTRTHDSLKISNGKWCWWSRGIGGRSALDYLIKVRGMSLPQAVIHINRQAATLSPAHTTKEPRTEPKQLLLPDRNENNDRVIAYLASRGISRGIIEFCIRTGRLYESRGYQNAVFVGFDREGTPRYGALRGTFGSRFMGDVAGSDKRYSFSITTKGDSARVHLFESAIDLLSFGTLELLADRDWRGDHYLSLAGVYKPRQNVEESALPVALTQYLKDFPKIKTVSLHLDNDEPGRLAAEIITVDLKDRYIIDNSPSPEGKDYNEMLQLKMGIQKCVRVNRVIER
jgi:hypothetical protein